MPNQDLRPELELRDKLIEEKTDRKFDQVVAQLGTLGSDLSEKIAAAKSDADTKFASIQTSIAALPGVWTIIGIALAAVALCYGAFQYGGQTFANGVEVQEISAKAAKDASDRVINASAPRHRHAVGTTSR